MNILYIPSWYPTPDNQYAGSFIQNLAKDIASKDFHITVVFPDSGILLNKKKEELGKNDYLKEYHLQFQFLPKGLPLVQDAWVNTCVKQILKTIDISDFDLIHSHGFIASFIGSSISKKYQKPHFVSYHYMGFIQNTIPKWRIKRLKQNKTSLHICPSNSLADALKKKLNINVSVIPNYVDTIPQKSISSEVKTTIRCLSVMYFEKVKNPIDLIKEFNKLPEKFKLDIIGDGTLKKDALQLIDKFNLSDRIRIIPTMERETLLKKYRKYDLFISSSEVETFGMCLLEAIAAGIPVVSVSHHGPTDFIRKENGILSSLETLKQDIISIVENNKYNDPIGISQSVDSYRKQEIIPMYLDFYKNFAQT